LEIHGFWIHNQKKLNSKDLVIESPMNSKNKAFLPIPMNLMGKALWKDLMIHLLTKYQLDITSIMI